MGIVNGFAFMATEMDVESLLESSMIMGTVFYILWTYLFLMFLANVFIAIFAEAYEQEKEAVGREEREGKGGAGFAEIFGKGLETGAGGGMQLLQGARHSIGNFQHGFTKIMRQRSVEAMEDADKDKDGLISESERDQLDESQAKILNDAEKKGVLKYRNGQIDISATKQALDFVISDAEPRIAKIDIDGDGLADVVAIDEDGDGVYDYHVGQETFRKMDKDGDGKLSKQELADHRSAKSQKSKYTVKAEVKTDEETADGWVKHSDKDGRIYYYNATLDKTQWTNPAEQPTTTIAVEPASDELGRQV